MVSHDSNQLCFLFAPALLFSKRKALHANVTPLTSQFILFHSRIFMTSKQAICYNQKYNYILIINNNYDTT